MSNNSLSNFSLELQYPVKTVRIFRLFWLALVLIVFVSLIVAERYWQLSLAAVVLMAGYFWQLQQFKNLYAKKQSLSFVQPDWFLQIGQEKQSIEILAETRLLPWWILIRYRLKSDDVENSKIFRKSQSLVIFKDALSDEQFRQLSRHLKFGQNS